jgi:hypothetical protein
LSGANWNEVSSRQEALGCGPGEKKIHGPGTGLALLAMAKRCRRRNMTKLEGELKRALTVDGKPYTLTLSPTGLRLTEKGKRIGQELSWKDLVSGQAALAVALNASLGER